MKEKELLLYSEDEVPEEDLAKLEERVAGHTQSAPEQQLPTAKLESTEPSPSKAPQIGTSWQLAATAPA